MEKRICSKCEKEIKKDGLFCPYCGEGYVEECVESNHVEQKICKTCGMKLPDDSVFCTYCGASCEDAEIYEENQQEMTPQEANQ